MPSDREASIFWYSSDSLVTPDALATDPFIKVGDGVVTLTDRGVDLNNNVATDPLYYMQLAIAGDSRRSHPRQRADMAVQAHVTGQSAAPSWASGASPIALFIDDGLRALALSIGSALQLISPWTGDVLWEVSTTHPWLFRHHYSLRKYGAARWVVEVDGVVVATLPYLLSGISAGTPAFSAVGCLDPAGTSRATFDDVELSCNRALAPQWIVNRIQASLPISIQTRWTKEARAWLRATVGLVQGAYDAMAWLWADMQADRYADQRFDLDGTVLPDETSPAWTLAGTPTLSIVRERVRLEAAADASDKVVRADFSVLPAFVPATGEVRIGGTLVVRSYTADANGRIGPVIRVRLNGRIAHAQLFMLNAVPVWGLTTGAIVGPVALVPGARPRRVNPDIEHHVELQVLGGYVVLLLVDHVIVDRRPFASFPVAAGNPLAEIIVPGSGALLPLCVVDLRGWVSDRRFSDLSRRQLLEARALEALQFTSGVDHNDELDTWVRSQQTVAGARGTTSGIVVEVRRLAAEHDNVFVVRDQEPGSWFLELSWPEVTPIYLEVAGYFSDVYVEFINNAPFFTSQQLADLCRRYLVPLSTEELAYHLCVITVLTAPMAIPGVGIWRVTVIDTKEFENGDTVTVRTPTNSERETTTVLSINSPTEMDLVAQGSAVPYTTNSVVRKILADT